MRLVLVDPKAELCRDWRDQIHDHYQVEPEPYGMGSAMVYEGTFEGLLEKEERYAGPAYLGLEPYREKYALVAAGNSYGLMDGGVDLAIRNYMGEQIQNRVQYEIDRHFGGRQPVGTSIAVPNFATPLPGWLLYSPTMNVPATIADTDNVYAAALASFIEAEKNGIDDVAMPGLGAATGKVPLKSVAAQILLAFQHYGKTEWRRLPREWDNVKWREQEIENAAHRR